MDALERDLRAQLRRQVETVPPVSLADVVVRRGRAARRRRTVAGALAVAGALSLGVAGVQALGDRREAGVPAASLAGLPRVPLSVVTSGGTGTELLDWPGGVARTRLLAEQGAIVAVVPAGVLLVDPSGLSLLAPDAEQPRLVVAGVQPFVALAPGGGRAVVVAGEGGGRVLQEVELPSGRVLRALPAGPALLPADQPLVPVAYTGAGVLLTAGEGDAQRPLLWEPGDGGVVGELSGYAAVEGGAGPRGAFRVTDDDRCRVEVAELTTGGRTWRLCREPFAAFSPGGRWVLATNADDAGLVVRDARDGSLVRTIDVPGGTRAYAFESEDAVLVTTVEDDRTVVLRCAVRVNRCATAVEFADTDRIPLPVPPG